jgi:hypothetical protein
MKTFRVFFSVMLASVTMFLGQHECCGQGTAFVYQGRLNANGTPANGNYDLRFKLFVDPFGNMQSGSTILSDAVPVTNGLFALTLDFGSVFNGSNYWLEVDVKTNLAGAYANLTPLQPVTPAPYAIFAENLSAGGLTSGTYSNAVSFSNPSNNFTGSGAALSNVNATTLGGLTAGQFWKTGGNAGTTAGTSFLGTTDNQPWK